MFIIHKISCKDQLMFIIHKISCNNTWQGLQSSQVMSLNLLSTSFGSMASFSGTLLKNILHITWYTRRTQCMPPPSGIIGSSSPQYISTFEEEFILEDFQNNRTQAVWKANYTLMLLSQNTFPVIQTPSQSLDRLRCQPNTGQEQCSSSSKPGVIESFIVDQKDISIFLHQHF